MSFFSRRFLVAAGLFATVAGCGRGTPFASIQTESLRCVDQFAAYLGIGANVSTDPETVKGILRDDMRLDDLPSARALVAGALAAPVPLSPMVEKIRTGIVEKHPAIGEFLCTALEEGLLPRAEPGHARHISRTLQHTYILDLLTRKMFEQPSFMAEVRAHLLVKREQLGIRPDFVGSTIDIIRMTGELFEPAKAKTMDWVFAEYERIRKEGVIPPDEAQTRRNGLVLNIIEAVLADRKSGFRENSIAGVGLAINPPEVVQVSGENRFIEYGLSQRWASLYESWNFAFITGNMENLELLYPKLLIPQVLAAPSNEYLFNRALSLWVSINFDLFAKARGRKTTLPNADRLAAAWGEVNLKYAQAFVREENEFELRGLGDLLRAPVQSWAADIIGSRIHGD